MKFILWECDLCRITVQTDDVPGEGPQPHGWKVLFDVVDGKEVETHLCPECVRRTAACIQRAQEVPTVDE
jgi:hypothetical protein